MSSRYDLVRRINSEANLLPYESDRKQFNVDEFWSSIYDTGKDDCDGYAVGKMKKLLEAGFPQSDLRYMFTLTEPFMIDGRMATPAERGHCVLIVSMLDGDLMLDNRQPLPVPVTEIESLGYEPISIQRVGGEPGWAPYGGVKAMEAA